MCPQNFNSILAQDSFPIVFYMVDLLFYYSKLQ